MIVIFGVENNFYIKLFVFRIVELKFKINQRHRLVELHLTVRAKALPSDSLCPSLALADELPHCVRFYSFTCFKTSLKKLAVVM